MTNRRTSRPDPYMDVVGMKAVLAEAALGADYMAYNVPRSYVLLELAMVRAVGAVGSRAIDRSLA